MWELRLKGVPGQEWRAWACGPGRVGNEPAAGVCERVLLLRDADHSAHMPGSAQLFQAEACVCLCAWVT